VEHQNLHRCPEDATSAFLFFCFLFLTEKRLEEKKVTAVVKTRLGNRKVDEL
jgi:hypothetical protein